MNTETSPAALLAACPFSVGDRVVRKGQPCGPVGTIEELFVARDHVDNSRREYTTKPRAKATVFWRHASTGGAGGHHSTLLVSSLQMWHPATAEQIKELNVQAQILGYSGIGDVEYLSQERAAKRLDDYRAGRVGKRRTFCAVCNVSHVYDEPRPCALTGYALYNTVRDRWAVYDMGAGRALFPNAATPGEALSVARDAGIAPEHVFISDYMRQRAALHGQEPTFPPLGILPDSSDMGPPDPGLH